MSTTEYSESFWLSEYGKRQPFIPFCKPRVHLKLIHLYPNSPNPIALSSITESQWYPVNFLELKIWFMIQSFFLGEKLSKRKNMINNTFSLAELSPHCSSTVCSFCHKTSSLFVQKPICLPLLHFETHLCVANFYLKFNASKNLWLKEKLKTESW